MTRNYVSVLSTLFVSVALFGAGCGKSPLTTEQKAIVANTFESAGNGQIAAKGAQATKQGLRTQTDTSVDMMAASGSPLLRTASLFAANPSTTKAPARKTNERSRAMEKKLTDSLDACEYSSGTPVAEGTVSKKSAASKYEETFKVSGEKCPIALDIAIKAGDNSSASEDSVKIDTTFSAKMSYLVKDKDFATLNDVTGFDLNGDLAVKYSQDQTGMSGSFNGKLAGQITSTEQGTVKFDIAMDLQGSASTAAGVSQSSASGSGSGEFVATFAFKDFEAEFKVTGNDNGATFEINGEKVEQAEFESYLEKLMGRTLSMGGTSVETDTTVVVNPGDQG